MKIQWKGSRMAYDHEAEKWVRVHVAWMEKNGLLGHEGTLDLFRQALSCLDSLHKEMEEVVKVSSNPCSGIGAPWCMYLAKCGQVCNKCGRIHATFQAFEKLRSDLAAAERQIKILNEEIDILRRDAS